MLGWLAFSTPMQDIKQFKVEHKNIKQFKVEHKNIKQFKVEHKNIKQFKVENKNLEVGTWKRDKKSGYYLGTIFVYGKIGWWWVS